MRARILAVVGTDTGVGKTVVTAAITAALRRRGLTARALKPVATGVEPGTAGEDAELLGRASDALPRDCVLATFRIPRSPLAAAAAEGTRIDVDGLERDIRGAAERADLLIVEGVGGVLVPVDDQHTVLDLVRALDAPVLVVGRPGLGTINHCALTVQACRHLGVEVAGVVLSSADRDGDSGLARENARRIARQCDAAVLGILPFIDGLDVAAMAAAARDHLDLGPVEALLDDTGSASRRDAIIALDRAHAWHPFTQTTEWLAEEPLVVRSARGCWLVDAMGRSYLDGISSLWANVHGHAHPVLDRALHEQAGRVAHATFLGQTHEPGARLAAELAAVTPAGLDRVFFSEAGAAAVEVALRVALLAQHHRGESRRTRFVSLEDAYHGDTAGAVSVGRSEVFHRGLAPLLVEVLRVPPPHLLRVRDGLDETAAEAASCEALAALLGRYGDEVAAVLIEPRVQGAAGIWVHSDDWLRAVASLAQRAGALLICDEVATGFGRTGDLFACLGAGMTPDILAIGKGLTGGYLPLSATVVTDELFELFSAPYAEHRTLYYGHTFTANPVACAVARASLGLFATEGTLQRARGLARRLREGLDDVVALAGVADVRHAGVMCGIELTADGLAEPFDPSLRVGRRVALAARRRGVVVRPLGDVLVLNPPLVMTDEEASLLIEVVVESIAEVARELC